MRIKPISRLIITCLVVTLTMCLFSTAYALSEGPLDCNCVELNDDLLDKIVEQGIQQDIGYKTSAIIDLKTIVCEVSEIPTECLRHIGKHELQFNASIVDGNDNVDFSIQNGRLIVSNFTDETATVRINVDIKYKGTMAMGTASAEIDVTVTRHTEKITVDAEYDYENAQIVATIHPNGNASADLYIDETLAENAQGVDGTSIVDGHIDFKQGIDGFKDATVYIPYNDAKLPVPLDGDSVKFERVASSNPTSNIFYIRVSWDKTSDQDNIVKLVAKAPQEEYNSDDIGINIKADELKYTLLYIDSSIIDTNTDQYKSRAIKVNSYEDDDTRLYSDLQVVDTKENNIVKYIGSRVKISVSDYGIQETKPELIATISKDLVYNTQELLTARDGINGETAKEYEKTLDEGNTIYLDILKMDDTDGIHDVLWAKYLGGTPKIMTAVIDNASEVKGELSVAGSGNSSSTDHEEGQLSYTSGVGDPDIILIKYWYEKVRDDVTCDAGNDAVGAYGYIKVRINRQDQISQPKGDSAEDIAQVYKRETGTEPKFMSNQSYIDVPLYALLDNDYDRELDENGYTTGKQKADWYINNGGIEVRAAKTTPNGTTLSVNKTTKMVRLVLPSTAYGTISFQYRLKDAQNWSQWVTSMINVEVSPAEPIPGNVNKMITRENGTTSLELNVDDPNHVGYTIAGNSWNLLLNGQPMPVAKRNALSLTKASTVNNGYSTEYFKFEIKNFSQFVVGDRISFTYRVNYVIGESKTSATYGTVTLTLTDGDNSVNEGYLYVHRKPIAVFTPKVVLVTDPSDGKEYVESCSISLPDELSYDLDHQIMHDPNTVSLLGTSDDRANARPNYSRYGIRAWEWGIRTQTKTDTSGNFGNWTTAVFDAQGFSGDTASTAGAPLGSTLYTNFNSYKYVEAARAAGVEWVNQQIQNKLASGGAQTIIISLRVRDIDNEEKCYVGKAPSDGRLATADELAAFRAYNDELKTEIRKEANSSGTINVEYKYYVKKVGVWSDAETVTLSAKEIRPIARFNVTPKIVLVPRSGTPTSIFTITDSSFDPNGGDITSWKWELTDYNDGALMNPYTQTRKDIAAVENILKVNLLQKVQNNWNPTGPHDNEFKIKLTVTKNAIDPDYSTSLTVSTTITVYIKNEPPEFILKSEDIKTYNAYEIDQQLDGYKGDYWGETTGSWSSVGKSINRFESRPGYPLFDSMFSIQDVDGKETEITMSWQFDGQEVMKRSDWSEFGVMVKTVIKSGIAYRASTSAVRMDNPLQPANNVTEAKMVPGAYRMQVSAQDAPSGNKYQEGSAETVYWQTFNSAAPYHLYVIPSLNIEALASANGWHMEKDEGSGEIVWVNDEDPTDKIASDDYAKLEDIAPTIGDTITITATTNKYVTQLYMKLGDEAGTIEDDKMPNINRASYIKMVKQPGTGANGEITWIGEYLIGDEFAGVDTAKGINLAEAKFTILAETNWGGENGEVTRIKRVPISVWVLPIKLYDFRVTEITDPSARDSFSSYVSKLSDRLDNGSKTDGALVPRLAVEAKDHSITQGTPEVKKGYGFYFKLCSKGLKKDTDEIHILTKFYGIDSSNNKVELVGYIPDRTGKYIPFTTEAAQNDNYIKSTYGLFYDGNRSTSLNNHYEVVITKDLRDMPDGSTEQTWSSRYGIPADAKFFKNGDSPELIKEWKGRILVMFDIAAYKGGQSRYDYVERGQWEKERNEIPISSKNIWGSIELSLRAQKLGAIIVYDGGASINNDYSSNPVWRE